MLRALSGFFRSASTPAATKIYAIGDIHGYSDAFEGMLDKIGADMFRHPAQNKEIIFLGDYINRGPDSSGVMTMLAEQKMLEEKDGIKRIFLRGNHDHAFNEFLTKDMSRSIPQNVRFFLDHGGLHTLSSYEVYLRRAQTLGINEHLVRGTNLIVSCETVSEAQQAMREALPAAHRNLLDEMKVSYESGDYIFVHAAIDPDRPMAEQSADMMMGLDMKSKKFPDYRKKLEGEKIVVHGHTVSPLPYSTNNQIGVETGVYRNGVLSCAVLEKKTVTFLQTETSSPLYKRQTVPQAPEIR